MGLLILTARDKRIKVLLIASIILGSIGACLFVLTPLGPSQEELRGKDEWGPVTDTVPEATDWGFVIIYDPVVELFEPEHIPTTVNVEVDTDEPLYLYILTSSSYQSWKCDSTSPTKAGQGCWYQTPPFVYSIYLTTNPQIHFSFTAREEDLPYYFVFVNKHEQAANVEVSAEYDWVDEVQLFPYGMKLQSSIPFLAIAAALLAGASRMHIKKSAK